MRFTDRLSTAYVDTNLVGTGKVSQAAILGQQGGVWAISSGLQVIQPLRHLLVTHSQRAILDQPRGTSSHCRCAQRP